MLHRYRASGSTLQGRYTDLKLLLHPATPYLLCATHTATTLQKSAILPLHAFSGAATGPLQTPTKARYKCKKCRYSPPNTRGASAT